MSSPSLPPGPRTPRALQTARWIARPAAFMDDAQRRYGDMFTLKITHEGTWVFLSHPDAVKQVFTGDPRLLHAGEANIVLLPVLGSNSVLLLDDDAHMAQRKLMLPSFHGERMRGYEQTMAEVAAREIERWPAGRPLAAWPTMQAITLEVIIRTVFGVRDTARIERLADALKSSLGFASEPLRMAILAAFGPRRVAQLDWVRRRLEPTDQLIYEEIRERRQAGDLADRDDVLSMLLQARHDDGSPMSDEELRDELMTLLVAGHETTATGLAWCFEALARHPDVQRRLHDDLESDDYLDAVCKETLRVRPVVPDVARKVTRTIEIGGGRVEAGATVWPAIFLTHHSEYEDAGAFRPERFLGTRPGTYTWLPFGGGPRRCVGAAFALMEMREVLRTVLERFEVSAVDPAPERPRIRHVTLVPSEGGLVRVSARAVPGRVAVEGGETGRRAEDVLDVAVQPPA